jgi:Xaa-Pro dipeptidase
MQQHPSGLSHSSITGRYSDVLLLHTPENICYLTGFQTSCHFASQALAVAPTGDPILLVRYIKAGWLAEHSWLNDCRTWRDGEVAVARTVDIVRELNATARRIALKRGPYSLSVSDHDRLPAAKSMYSRPSTSRRDALSAMCR